MNISIRRVVKIMAKAALYTYFIAAGVLVAVAGILSVGSRRSSSPDRTLELLSVMHDRYMQVEFPKRDSSFLGMAGQFSGLSATGGGAAIPNNLNYLMCFLGCPDYYKISADGRAYLYLCDEGDPMGVIVVLFATKSGVLQQVGFSRMKEFDLQGYERFLPQEESDDRGQPGI